MFEFFQLLPCLIPHLSKFCTPFSYYDRGCYNVMSNKLEKK